MVKKLMAFFMCASLLFAGVPSVYAEENKATVELSCKSAVLMEAETGKIIYAFNENERLPEASITKIMTMLLVFEAVDSGKISMDDMVTCSEHAASMGGSQIWLEQGEQMSVGELIKAAMVGSANDASVALAEHVAGTHENFVVMMNDRAQQLGMNQTAYKNCTGLDADGHLTSALDIAIVSAELLRHEKVLDYSTIWMDSLRGGELQLANTNKLLRQYSGCIGLKTGTTSQAGCCVSACAQRDGMTLIAVVLGAPNSKERFGDAAKLLDLGFANWELVSLDSLRVSTGDIAVGNGMSRSVSTYLDMTGDVLVPKGRAADISTDVNVAQSVTAPVEYGQIVGTVTLKLDGEIIGEYNILADARVQEITFSSVFALFIKGILKI